MHQFYCPKCQKDTDIRVDNTSQAISLPDFSILNGNNNGFALHFICCTTCNTVVSTIAIPAKPWTKE